MSDKEKVKNLLEEINQLLLNAEDLVGDLTQESDDYDDLQSDIQSAVGLSQDKLDELESDDEDYSEANQNAPDCIRPGDPDEWEAEDEERVTFCPYCKYTDGHAANCVEMKY